MNACCCCFLYPLVKLTMHIRAYGQCHVITQKLHVSKKMIGNLDLLTITIKTLFARICSCCLTCGCMIHEAYELKPHPRRRNNHRCGVRRVGASQEQISRRIAKSDHPLITNVFVTSSEAGGHASSVICLDLWQRCHTQLRN